MNDSNHYTINLNSRPSVVYFTLQARFPMTIKMVGYDSTRMNTVYFNRDINIKGDKPMRVEFPMPISPDVLTVAIQTTGAGFNNLVGVLNVEKYDMPSRTITYPKGTMEYVNFIKNFTDKMGERQEGFFVSNNENFIIWLKPNIDTSSTPAKVNRRTGVIKVSTSQLHKYTVPMRMFILLHEFFHWYYNTTSEFKADLNALNLYLDLGFPKSEANYAMTKIFTSGKEATERVALLDRMIKQRSTNPIVPKMVK